jgi:site-specific recombinase XerD
MNLVQPIRDLDKIKDMKKHLLLGKNGLRNNLLFTLGINSGLRISDLLKLKIIDVLDEKGKPIERIQLKEKKTKKNKDFPLGKNVQKAIKEYVSSLENIDLEQPLFKSRKGNKPISKVQAWEILNNAADWIGIKENIGSHSLRKTFGYHAYINGADITRIQKLLNHSAPSITLAYIGITQDELDDIVLNLNL